jgi:hypothetical protein
MPCPHGYENADYCELCNSEAEAARLRELLRESLPHLKAYKEDSPLGGCVYCGFARKKCALDILIENVEGVVGEQTE